MIFIIELIGKHVLDNVEFLKNQRTRLFDGSGEFRENSFGSSFTRSGGLSNSFSFSFPLSLRFDLPLGAEGSDGSRRLVDEFDLERDGSLSKTTADESESITMGWETEFEEQSMDVEGSRATACALLLP
jgi:hypothetical protein